MHAILSRNGAILQDRQARAADLDTAEHRRQPRKW
jgi:hypothetical protein